MRARAVAHTRTIAHPLCLPARSHTPRSHARTNARTSARTHACMHAGTHARTHARTKARTHARTHVRARAISSAYAHAAWSDGVDEGAEDDFWGLGGGVASGDAGSEQLSMDSPLFLCANTPNSKGLGVARVRTLKEPVVQVVPLPLHLPLPPPSPTQTQSLLTYNSTFTARARRVTQWISLWRSATSIDSRYRYSVSQLASRPVNQWENVHFYNTPQNCRADHFINI